MRESSRRQRTGRQAVVTGVAALLLSACAAGHRHHPGHSATLTSAHHTPGSTSSPPRSRPGPTPQERRARAARQALRRLVHSRRRGSISVAAYDFATDHEITGGAVTGMMPASVAKVELLETLLLRAQRSAGGLSYDEQADARAMIENSDNNAADDVYYDDGAGPGLVAALRPLGLSHRLTKPSFDDYWGLAPTSAPQQIPLLRDLVSASSPLDRASRRDALDLMRDVEADQRWGVPVAADPHTRFAVKNGWLGIDDDDGLWAVNSDGVITVVGHTVVMSVMTQHDPDFASGVRLVERIARAAAAVITAER